MGGLPEAALVAEVGQRTAGDDEPDENNGPHDDGQEDAWRLRVAEASEEVDDVRDL